MEQKKTMSYNWELFKKEGKVSDTMKIAKNGLVRFSKSFMHNYGLDDKKFVKLYFFKEKGYSFIGFNFCNKKIRGETKSVSTRSGHDQGSYVQVKSFAERYKINLPCLLIKPFLDQINNENIIGFLLTESKE